VHCRQCCTYILTHCPTLPHTAPHCTHLGFNQCIAGGADIYCNSLHHTAPYRSTLSSVQCRQCCTYIATHCTTLQHRNTLQDTATHLGFDQYIAGSAVRQRLSHPNLLQCVAIMLQWGCNVLQCVTVCCSVLQCVTVCGSALQCVAACCSMLQCVAVFCSVLPCVAVCCGVLRCDAVCCSQTKYLDEM